MASETTTTPPASNPGEEQAKAQLLAIRKARHEAKFRKPEDFKEDLPEQKVAVFVNNGTQHTGFRAIGRYFPNGLTTDVPVTEEELAELLQEPQDIIRVVDAAEVASMAGKGSSGSLTAEEHRVLAHFRSSGLGSGAYLAQLQKTGTGTKPASSGSESSSKASTEEPQHTGKRK